MRWLESITNLIHMNLSKLQEIVKHKEAWYAAVHGVTKSRAQLSDGKTTTIIMGISLAVQLLRLHASAARDLGSIPCQGTKIPYAMQRGQKIKKRYRCNLVVKDSFQQMVLEQLDTTCKK